MPGIHIYLNKTTDAHLTQAAALLGVSRSKAISAALEELVAALKAKETPRE